MLSLQNLIDNGVHFGHEIRKWNPKMKPFVWTTKNGIHIINLQKTYIYAKKAFRFLKSVTSKGRYVLFVATKQQAFASAKEAAELSGQFYISKRWLGGTLTNFDTLKVSIDRMKKIQKMQERFALDKFSKKEQSRLSKEYNKKEAYFCGIKNMKSLPSALFIVDIYREKIALREAKRLGIPVVALVDTNVDPMDVDFPIPANDDSFRSIALFTKLAGEACMEGKKQWEESLTQSKDVPQKQVQEVKKSNTPFVVSVNKTRKLVAAGTAEDVEIKMELEKETKEITKPKEKPEEKLKSTTGVEK